MEKLRLLKVRKTKLLNKMIKTFDEFVETQNKLNELEFQIKELEKGER